MKWEWGGEEGGGGGCSNPTNHRPLVSQKHLCRHSLTQLWSRHRIAQHLHRVTRDTYIRPTWATAYRVGVFNTSQPGPDWSEVVVVVGFSLGPTESEASVSTEVNHLSHSCRSVSSRCNCLQLQFEKRQLFTPRSDQETICSTIKNPSTS